MGAAVAENKLANKLLADPALSAAELQANLPPAPPPSVADPAALDDAMRQTAYLAGSLKGLLTQKTVSRKDIFRLTSDLMNAGVITAPQAAKELAGLPASDQQLKPWLFMKWAEADQAVDELSAMFRPEVEAAPNGMSGMGAPMGASPAGPPMPAAEMPPPGPRNRMLG